MFSGSCEDFEFLSCPQQRGHDKIAIAIVNSISYLYA